MARIEQAVWDTWFDDAREEPGVTLLLAGAAETVGLLPRVKAIVDRVTDDLDGSEEDIPVVEEVVATPDGVCLVVADGDNLRLLLEPVAVELTRAHIGGAFVPYPVSPARVRRADLEVELLECRVTIPAEHDGFADIPHWQTSPEALRDAVRSGLSWLASSRWADTHVTTGTVRWSVADEELVEALLPASLAVSGARGDHLVTVKGARFRAVSFLPHEGHVAFAVGPLPDGRPASDADVAAALDALQACASWACYGFVRRSRGLLGLGSEWKLRQEQQGLPERKTGQDSHREIEEHALLDAFGAQLVPRTRMVRVPQDRWLVHHVGQLDLLVARDLQAWWGASQPATETLAQARADLAGLLPA
ncbi:hypothetical protein ACFO0M_17430 [Micromonospora mangrovi]|uniref:Uncharacterized protein n=2 Tax=Micromonospora TaxID=1873 RepID=A0AAU7MBD2_9ACTN